MTARVSLVELKVSSRSHAGHTTVSVRGEIDLYTAPQLQEELSSALNAEPERLLIDMSQVEFCDSTGMNVLLSALKQAKEQGGMLELAGPRPAVRKILQVTGLDSVFTVHDTTEAANPAHR